MFSFACGVMPVSADTKKVELEQKIADIELLYQQLHDRTEQARSIRSGLEGQRDLLIPEIQVLIKSLDVQSYQQGQQHLRIKYNVELLSVIFTYMDALQAKINLYHSGRDRLAYLRQLVEDDIKMISTLNDLKIDALTTQISLVINRFLPDAHIIQVDPEKLQMISERETWQRVIQKKY
ncbi:MAG: hypothetical protein HKP58_06300 [Desulfatitalea sp.]|nr:hypothetical protein [Desulfatitalea sp.]NNK00009.1 hypothetical protein [Desulfatitalea sp.]